MRKVNVYPERPIFLKNMTISNTLMGANMNEGTIEYCLMTGARVDEVTDKGIKRLDYPDLNHDRIEKEKVGEEPVKAQSIKPLKIEEKEPVKVEEPITEKIEEKNDVKEEVADKTANKNGKRK